MNKRKNYQSGFTLLELIVSIGLFLVATFVALGSVVSMFSANSKSQTLASSVSNINYSMEGMARNIKFATTYHCGNTGTLTSPSDCISNSPVNGDTSFAVSSSTGIIKYQFNSTNNNIEVSEYGGAWKPVTGKDVTIQYARFYVGNTNKPDRYQPYILMVIRGYSGTKPSSQTYFDLETWVSQRPLDI